MAFRNYRSSKMDIALVATAALLSRPGRRLLRKGTASALNGAIKTARVVARGTRNMREARKHVTRF